MVIVFGKTSSVSSLLAFSMLANVSWRQHSIAKAMYKEMKINPFRFPEA